MAMCGRLRSRVNLCLPKSSTSFLCTGTLGVSNLLSSGSKVMKMRVLGEMFHGLKLTHNIASSWMRQQLHTSLLHSCPKETLWYSQLRMISSTPLLGNKAGKKDLTNSSDKSPAEKKSGRPPKKIDVSYLPKIYTYRKHFHGPKSTYTFDITWMRRPYHTASLSSYPNPTSHVQRKSMSTSQISTDSHEHEITAEDLEVPKDNPARLSEEGTLPVSPNLSEEVTLPVKHATVDEAPVRIKFKRLSKTAKHIMIILDKEAVENVRKERRVPNVQPGCIVELKVEVPENNRRISIIKGIVIARRNSGLNTTFRVRRMVAGVGVEAVFHLYSPNLKEITILERKKVKRAKLYHLREKMISIK